RLRQAEFGVLGRDREIAGGENLDAAAEAESVHCSDDRLPQVEPFRDAGEASGRILVLAGPRKRFQIGAYAKGAIARAGDDGDTQLRILGVAVERPRQLDMRVAMQRI